MTSKEGCYLHDSNVAEGTENNKTKPKLMPAYLLWQHCLAPPLKH